MKYSKMILISLLIGIMLSACTMTKETLEDKQQQNNNDVKVNNETEINQVEEKNNEPVIIKSDMIITRDLAAKMITM